MTETFPAGLRRLLLTICLATAAVPALASPANPPANTDVRVIQPLDIADIRQTYPDAAAVLMQLPAAQAPAPSAAATPVSGRMQALLQRAIALLGIPYRWGGTTTAGFDCSGLVGYVFRTALGVELPRVSREMATRGWSVRRDQLAEGDLVFFSRGGGINHVGIYVGNGQFLHAPRTGRDVTISRLDAGYWAQHFVSARRVAEL